MTITKKQVNKTKKHKDDDINWGRIPGEHEETFARRIKRQIEAEGYSEDHSMHTYITMDNDFFIPVDIPAAKKKKLHRNRLAIMKEAEVRVEEERHIQGTCNRIKGHMIAGDEEGAFNELKGYFDEVKRNLENMSGKRLFPRNDKDEYV